MMTLIIVLHVIVCILLIAIILVQAGRGGGFVEGFSGVESMFGTKTSSFLTRTTAVLSTLFFITCLTLAFLSARQGKSLMQSAPAVVSQPAQDESAGKKQEAEPKKAEAQPGEQQAPGPQSTQ